MAEKSSKTSSSSAVSSKDAVKEGKGKESTGSSTKGSSGRGGGGGVDSIFKHDKEHIDMLRKEMPWKNDPRFFRNCRVSALAAMKMLKHALSGVDKGRKAGTNAIEVMGLLIGKPEGDSIVVLDTVALPVTGTEVRVVADDRTDLLMLQLQTAMEVRRPETFVGWYHSHPFPLMSYSHCHLSNTDVLTQRAFQGVSSAGAGSIWTAIVIDPERSLVRQEPELGAFRCYPKGYSPKTDECPDGSVMSDSESRATRWGHSHDQYYSLKTSYFMSGLGSQLLELMSRNSLWVGVLAASQSMEQETRERFAERLKKASEKLGSVDTSIAQSGGLSSSSSSRFGMHGHGHSKRRGGGGGGGGGGSFGSPANEELSKTAEACEQLAIECCKGHASQLTKDLIFNLIARQEQRQREQREKGEEINSMNVEKL